MWVLFLTSIYINSHRNILIIISSSIGRGLNYLVLRLVLFGRGLERKFLVLVRIRAPRTRTPVNSGYIYTAYVTSRQLGENRKPSLPAFNFHATTSVWPSSVSPLYIVTRMRACLCTWPSRKPCCYLAAVARLIPSLNNTSLK